MELVKVNSSNIKAVGWENNTLFIAYNSGIYMYEDVKRELYEQLLNAESKGKFVCENIKPNFSYKKVE